MCKCKCDKKSECCDDNICDRRQKYQECGCYNECKDCYYRSSSESSSESSSSASSCSDDHKKCHCNGKCKPKVCKRCKVVKHKCKCKIKIVYKCKKCYSKHGCKCGKKYIVKIKVKVCYKCEKKKCICKKHK